MCVLLHCAVFVSLVVFLQNGPTAAAVHVTGFVGYSRVVPPEIETDTVYPRFTLDLMIKQENKSKKVKVSRVQNAANCPLCHVRQGLFYLVTKLERKVSRKNHIVLNRSPLSSEG